MARSKRVDELSSREDCYHGSRHLPTRIYTTTSGRKDVMIDWTDQAPGPDGRRHDHAIYPTWKTMYCRICRRLAMLSDCRGKPCHKVCAEKEWLDGYAAAPQETFTLEDK